MFFRSAILALALVFMLRPTFAEIPTAPANLPAEDVAEIRNMIIGQIDAFRKDDAEKAFSFAAPRIREIFRTPEVFLYMVRIRGPQVLPGSLSTANIRIPDHPEY